MTPLPHDVPDLYLAPVALAIDARIEELGRLDLDELRSAVALASDQDERTQEMRELALLDAIGHLTELHGWALSWDPRGIRLTHEAHTFVLGVPEVFRRLLTRD